MPVLGVSHINIRTTDVAASAKFYVDLLDFELRQGPEVMGRRGNWLYDGCGQPIIHFRSLEPDSPSTGPIDHIALACSGREEIVRRLRESGTAFDMAEGVLEGFSQIILRDPHGIRLELNFEGE